MENEIKIKVVNKIWTVGVYTQRQYARRNGTNSRAICDPDTKRLEFDFRASNDITIMHEVNHCYASELGIVERQLDDDQIEEFMCEMFARHYKDIIQNKDLVLEFLLDFTKSLVGKK